MINQRRMASLLDLPVLSHADFGQIAEMTKRVPRDSEVEEERRQWPDV